MLNQKKAIYISGSHLFLLFSFMMVSFNIKAQNPIYGRWRIKNWTNETVAALTGEEANTYIGTYISFQPGLAVYFGDSCTSPVYKIDTVNTDEYLNKEHRGITRKDFNITTNKIVIILITCKLKPIKKSRSSPSFHYVLIKIDDERGVIDYNGIDFFVVKEHLHKDIPEDGDTVRCIYGKKCK